MVSTRWIVFTPLLMLKMNCMMDVLFWEQEVILATGRSIIFKETSYNRVVQSMFNGCSGVMFICITVVSSRSCLTGDMILAMYGAGCARKTTVTYLLNPKGEFRFRCDKCCLRTTCGHNTVLVKSFAHLHQIFFSLPGPPGGSQEIHEFNV